MRFSHFLLPLFLTFSLHFQSLSALNSIIGTWSNPSISLSESDYCCVPTSLTIENSGLDKYTAIYKYDKEGEYYEKCFSLFLQPNRGKLNLYRKSGEDIYYSEMTSFGSKTFNLNVTNSTSLNIYIVTLDEKNDSCDFSMNSKEAFASSNGGGHIVFYVSIGIIILAAFASYKKYQSKQQAIMMKQNLTQPQSPSDYVVSNQQFFRPQTQRSYTAPGQFRSTNSSISVDMNGVN